MPAATRIYFFKFLLAVKLQMPINSYDILIKDRNSLKHSKIENQNEIDKIQPELYTAVCTLIKREYAACND